MRKMNESKNTNCNSSSSENPNPCPICLGPVIQESYLDQCFHKFCYDCIIRWTKVVACRHSRLSCSIKCPLCKTENFSVVHGYDGSSFQQQFINQDFGDSFSLSKVHKYRLQCYYTEPGILNDKFNVQRYWKLHKYCQPNQWLQRWLRREIQALIQKEPLFVSTKFPDFPILKSFTSINPAPVLVTEFLPHLVQMSECLDMIETDSIIISLDLKALKEQDVDIIVHHILGVIGSVIERKNDQKGQTISPERKREEFKTSVSDAARPFLAARTDRFVNEVELFLASGLNIEAYDEVYMQRLGWNGPTATTESAEEHNGHTHVVPYLYLFDYDSDDTD